MHSHRRRTAVKAVHVAVLALTLSSLAPAAALAAPPPAAEQALLGGIPSWYLRRILPAFLRVAPPIAPEAVPVEEPGPVLGELSPAGAEQPALSQEPAGDSSDLEQPVLQDDDTDGDSAVLTTNERPSSDLFLRASVSPWLVFPGDVVTYTVAISAAERMLKDITLVKPVPDEVEVLSAPGATYDGEKGELSWSLDELKAGQQEEVSFQGRIAAGTEMSVIQKWFEATGTVADVSGESAETKALTTILVGESKIERLSEAGGTLTTLDGLVEFKIPAGAVTQSTQVRVIDFPFSPYWQAPDLEWLAFFGLEAIGEEGLAPRSKDGHTRFLKPLRVTVDLSDRAGVMSPYVLHVDGTTGEILQHVESVFDEDTGVLAVELQTFSYYGVPGASPYPSDGSYYLYQSESGVDLFSGALSYRYTIAVPPVASGMAPDLALSYNNRVLDGIKGIVQSPEVGVGWSLSGVPYVTREIKTKRKKGTPNWETLWEYKNNFYLSIGGASHFLLLGEQTGSGCRYYTQERSGLHVMRYNGLCGYDGSRPPDSETGEYWVARLPNGTTYRLGYTANSEHVVSMQEYKPELCTMDTCSNWGYWDRLNGYTGDLTGTVAYGWSADLVWDVYSNTMEYHYDEERRTDVGENVNDYDREVHLEWVAYGGNGAEGTPNCYRIDVGLRERKKDGGAWYDDGPGDGYGFSLWMDYLVQTMTVSIAEPVSGVCTNTQIVSEHVLEYDTQDLYTTKYNPYYVKEWLLETITPYGRGGKAGGHQLPKVEFDYTDLRQFAFDESPYLRYDRVDDVKNGYGGRTQIEYERLQPSWFYEFSYRVESEWGQDGLGNTSAITYTYDGECVIYGTNEDEACRRPGELGALRLFGHEETTKTVYGYDDELLRTERHEFSVDEDGERGRETYIEVKLADGTVVMTTTNSWSVIMDCLGSEGQFCIDLSWTQSCQEGDCRKVEYGYDTFGNPLAEYDYGDITASGDERSIHRALH